MIAWLFGKKKVSEPSTGKDDFVSLSSHELRSPLSIIKWYTEMLLDEDAGPLTEEQRKYLSVIQSSNQRAIDLVRSLLNVSRLDLGTFSILPREVSLHEIVKEIVASFSEEVSKRKVTILLQGGLPQETFIADKHLCEIVIKNIISNAVNFSKQDSFINVDLSLIPKGNEIGGKIMDDTYFVITVSDTGIGIPEGDKGKIFSKMFRASNVKDENGNGSGLGLYITKSILSSVKGMVWFTSQENSGSVFYVALPAKAMTKKEGRTTLD
jgi:signal transduction histidine kinase